MREPGPAPPDLLAALRRILVELGAPLEQLLRTANDVVRETFGADRSAIFLGRGAEILPVARHRLSEAYLDSVVRLWREGPGGQVLQAKAPIVVADVRAGGAMGALEAAALAEGFRTIMITPLVYGGEAIGAVALYHDEPATYGEAELDRVRVLVEPLALAVENAGRQERLEAERRRWAELVELIPAGVLLVDANVEVEVANRAAREILAGEELGRDVLEGRKPMVDRAGRSLGPGDMPVRRALAGEVIVGEEMTVLLARGQPTTILVGARPFGNGAVVVFQDVTAQRELEHLEEVFIQALAQQVRDPLTALRAYIAVLQDQLLQEGHPASGLAARVGERIGRLSVLVSRLLDLAVLVPGGPRVELEEVRLDQLVGECTERVGKARGQDVRLQHRGPVEARVDRRRLRRAITELLENAVAHGGAPVEVELEGEAGHVAIRVDDRGPGLAEELRAAMFDTCPLVPWGGRAPRALGLCVIQAIARAHGGLLEYHPRAGGGSSFTLTVPRLGPRASVQEPPHATLH